MTLRRDRSGVAAIETALLAPLLVTSLIGITDFSMALLSRAQIARALAGSAQYATLAGQNGVATATIVANAKSMAGTVTNAFVGAPTASSVLNNGAAAGASCCPATTWRCSTSAGFTCADGSAPGTYLTVSVSYPFNAFWPADTWLLGKSIADSVVAPVKRRRCAGPLADRRGSTAVEFAILAPVLLTLMFGGLEYARLLWTWQALQITGDETARCVAIGNSACAAASTYAVTTATNNGAIGLVAANVQIANQPPAITKASACNRPAGTTEVQVTLSLPFSSVAGTLIPALRQTLTTSSCYPLTGN